MARPKQKAKIEERRFDIHELFFSTTDRKGVIRSGNEVFRRVAAFDSIEDMIGKPHNIVRHPDMPRAAFRLVWDYLEQDKPVVAYVKNQAADGAYYWVVAFIVPIKDGYLSVRFKPSGPYFEVVQALYAELLGIEAKSGDKPGLRQQAMELAGVRLGETLKQKGFASYDDFMRMVLATEMSSRAKLIADHEEPQPVHAGDSDLARTLSTCSDLESKLDGMFNRVESFLSMIAKLESSSAFLRNLSEQIHLLSLNSLISSHRMGETGRGLAVVADDLARISGNSTLLIEDMTRDIFGLVGGLREAAFRISGAKLQVGISITFLNELLEGKADSQTRHREYQDLHVLSESFAEATHAIACAIPLLEDPLSCVVHHLKELSAAVKSLSRVHLIGRVEAAHSKDAEGFLQLFDEVDHQLQAARAEIKSFNESIQSLTQGLPVFQGDSRALQEGLGGLQLMAA